MALNADELGQAAGALMKDARTEWAQRKNLQRHIDGQNLKTWMPNGADAEYRDLLRKSASPWLAFVRDAIAQGCRVSGYSDEVLWELVWRANGMDGRQGVSTREAIGLGKSYVLVLPADGGGVVVRPMSALKTFAVFADPWDTYPSQVLYRIGPQKASFWDSEWYFIDEVASYRFTGSPATPKDIRVSEHGLGFTPVVEISNELTTDAEPRSSVAGAVPIYKRIVDATFTLQMIQRYGAFPQKWMAGGTLGDVRVSVDSMIHAEGDGGETARFGTFEAADPVKIIAALDAHIKHLSAVCQVPPHYLLGAVVNMSAEGIAAAESGYHRNLGERKAALGEGYELVMRTAAAIMGDSSAANDASAHVEWENVSSWSLNQVADAISKLDATQADLAKLYQLIPGWTKSDAIEAAEVAYARRALPAEAAPEVEAGSPARTTQLT